MWRLVVLVMLTGCELFDPRPLPADECEAASEVLLRCGVALPLLVDGACVGLRSALARCTLEHSETCDALATLSERPDLCLESLVDPPPRIVEPTTPLFPGPPGDGGTSSTSDLDGGRP